MEEIKELLTQILNELQETNGYLSSLSRFGKYDLGDVVDKLDNISGSGLHDLDDVCDKLGDVSDKLDSIYRNML